MVGSKTRLVGHLKQVGVKCVFLHCVIHQEVLCGNIIKINQMKMAVNIIYLFCGRNKAQRHRAIITFFKEMDADYGDIPLHSDIRWFSVGKCLQHFFFFALRKEILLFLQTENPGQELQMEI
jgi:hypothetical protein